MIVRDALAPENDPVRLDGSDDPSGGPLDGAADVRVLGHRGHAAAPAPYGFDKAIDGASELLGRPGHVHDAVEQGGGVA
jgi:hypothetical protein